MRIFDNPNHPQYGPVRRMWVVLAQLDLLTAAERYSEHYLEDGGLSWDENLAFSFKHNKRREAHIQRHFIGTLLEGWL
jgi:hypothetical protein